MGIRQYQEQQDFDFGWARMQPSDICGQQYLRKPKRLLL
jgi:hypothetical protein